MVTVGRAGEAARSQQAGEGLFPFAPLHNQIKKPPSRVVFLFGWDAWIITSHPVTYLSPIHYEVSFVFCTVFVQFLSVRNNF